MLDLKFIRENPDVVRQAIRNKNESADVDHLLQLDQQRRDMLRRVEELKHQRNVASNEIAKLKKAGQDASEQIVKMRQVSDEIKKLDEEIRQIEHQIKDILIWIPNIPHPSVPVGPDSSFNQEIKRWGKIEEPDFEPKPHWEIGERLDILDFNRASKLAGSNWSVH